MAMKPDPMGDRRNPFQVYLLALTILSGISTMLPGRSTTSSVQRYLDHPYDVIWGALLTLGAALTLLGMYWQGDARDGLVFKRTGLAGLVIPAAVYGIILIALVGVGAFLAGFTILGFAVACFVQWRRVHHHTKTLIHIQEVQERCS